MCMLQAECQAASDPRSACPPALVHMPCNASHAACLPCSDPRKHAVPAVAALQLAVEALEGSQQRLAAAGLEAGGDAQLLPALRARLAGLQERVASHQDPSRLLRWTGSRGSTSAQAS